MLISHQRGRWGGRKEEFFSTLLFPISTGTTQSLSIILLTPSARKEVRGGEREKGVGVRLQGQAEGPRVGGMPRSCLSSLRLGHRPERTLVEMGHLKESPETESFKQLLRKGNHSFNYPPN